MKLIHSLNTRPWVLNAYGYDGMTRMTGTVWYYALSVAYAQRIGAEIELHTDTLGARLLGHLPYSDIRLSLDDMPRGISPRFWAAGKIFALEASRPGDVHIDGDVFIKKRQLLDDIASSHWDVVVQSEEDENWVRNCYIPQMGVFRRHCEQCEAVGLNLDDTAGAYNTGLLGIRSEEVRRSFTDGYRKLTEGLSAAQGDYLDGQIFATPDLVAEQLYIRQVAQANGAEVKVVLEAPGTDEPVEKGYQHVLTSRKFNELSRVKALLEAINAKIYTQTKRLCHT